MVDCSISIIIPAYNVEKYLKAALDSIKDQTKLPDEVILINDGSTDRTQEVAEAYQFPVPYQVVSIKNGGQGNARNLGVSLASSKYVYFFDSDDLMVSSAIEVMAREVIAGGYPDIIFFSGESFVEKGYQTTMSPDYVRPFEVRSVPLVKAIRKFSQYGEFKGSPCLYLSKRELWNDSGLKFKKIIHEDEEVVIPLLLLCKKISVIKDVLFQRRIRPGSTMTTKVGARNVEGLSVNVRTLVACYEKHRESVEIRMFLVSRIKNYIIKYIKASASIHTIPDLWLTGLALQKSRAYVLLFKLPLLYVAYYLKSFNKQYIK